MKELEDILKAKEDHMKNQEGAIKQLKDSEAKFRKEIEHLKAQVMESAAMTTQKSIDPF